MHVLQLIVHMSLVRQLIVGGLFQKDENYNPTVEISGLHESLIEFDPSGNEMRPRGTKD
jgi:hypothetical protein